MTPRFSVVGVAARTPPVSGQSVAADMLFRQLRRHGIACATVDMSRALDGGPGIATRLRRAAEVARLAPEALWRGRLLPPPVVGYLQLGQSARAIARDVPVLAAFRLARWPAVAHIHGGGFRTALEAAPPWLGRLMRRALRHVATVVVLTPRLRAMLAGLVPEERVAVVDNGVDEDLAQAAGRARPPGGAPRPFTAVYLGNLIASKGYPAVLDAAALAHRRGLDLRFVLAGARTGESIVDPERHAREHGLANVSYLGPVYGDAKAALLASADVLLLPTAYPIEGQPLAILEAMHFGLPVITCAQGGIADVIVDGQNGLLVPRGDAAAMLGAVAALAADPALARRMGELNRRIARQRYTEVLHGRAMLAILADAVAGTARVAPAVGLP